MSILQPDKSFPAAERLEAALYQLQENYRRHGAGIRQAYMVSALEMEILQYTARNPERKLRDVGAYFGIKLSTLTSVIDKIEAQALVERCVSPGDRRVVYLQLTDKGQSLYDAYSEELRRNSAHISHPVEPSLIESFTKGLSLPVPANSKSS